MFYVSHLKVYSLLPVKTLLIIMNDLQIVPNKDITKIFNNNLDTPTKNYTEILTY